ncbi:Dcp1-like decapping family [Nesidiocoris tenuis]|uniref:Dcp1-like decapping family n=1 Tax=Nesidiocoris tenuis TaxID=355587 RepID=A0ABN7BG27_9HEMI|nr:Dcp1-like decapping family [Nesidiocoris tenuis]
MAKSESSSMNVSALKLKDPYFKDILDMATHVALYNYNSDTQSWEKTEVEGAYFIYSRTKEPFYYALIMNRLNTSDHIEYIDENVELQLDEPFILYKNAQGLVHGIWFYDREDCSRISKLIERLSHEIARSKSNKVEANSRRNDAVQASETETNRRVMDFFARAGGKAPFSRPPPVPMAAINMNEVNPVVQRLLSTSNPVQTVEEIEKRQKVCSAPEERVHGNAMIHRASGQPSSGPVPIQRQLSEPQPIKSLENGLSYLRLANGSPAAVNASSIPTQCFFNSSLRQASSPKPEIPLEVSVLERAVIDPPSKPALLPPVMFTTNPKPQEEAASSLGHFGNPTASSSGSDPNLGLQPPNSYGAPPGAGAGNPAGLSPLTKAQLLQAVNYLLKNDADFVNKLHEAYVKSFVDMVS